MIPPPRNRVASWEAPDPLQKRRCLPKKDAAFSSRKKEVRQTLVSRSSCCGNKKHSKSETTEQAHHRASVFKVGGSVEKFDVEMWESMIVVRRLAERRGEKSTVRREKHFWKVTFLKRRGICKEVTELHLTRTSSTRKGRFSTTYCSWLLLNLQSTICRRSVLGN